MFNYTPPPPPPPPLRLINGSDISEMNEFANFIPMPWIIAHGPRPKKDNFMAPTKMLIKTHHLERSPKLSENHKIFDFGSTYGIMAVEIYSTPPYPKSMVRGHSIHTRGSAAFWFNSIHLRSTSCSAFCTIFQVR